MIGTGVFTSLGFQAQYVKSPLSLLLLWIIGGVIALCGALSYGELAVLMPRSGGEYCYLSRIYHPALGFVSGFLSATVGFSAPIGLCAIAFAKYLTVVYPFLHEKSLAFFTVILITFIHIFNIKASSFFQILFTVVKILLIIFLIACGLFLGKAHGLDTSLSVVQNDLLNPLFAVGLVFVTYSYSGWNTSIYLASEVKNPASNLPLSLITGALIVLVLYILLNYTFLNSVEIQDLQGKLEVAHLFSKNIFGDFGGKLISIIISLSLISTISSLVMAGPRVIQVIGEDYLIFKLFAKKNKNDIPLFAFLLQLFISLLLILTSTFEVVLVYIGFTINIVLFLTVLGVFVLRIKHPELERTYKVPFYPFTPFIFLAFNLWILLYLVYTRPFESIFGFCTILVGLVFYYVSKTFPSRC